MAKRVNKPFLIGLLLVPLLVFMGAALWAHFGHSRGDPKKLLAEGDRLFAAGEYDKARMSYAQATQADPTSTVALVKLGDAAAKLITQDVSHLHEADAAWNRALSLNPRDTGAMSRLLDSYWDLIDLGVRSQDQAPLLTKCREWADRLATADPSNQKAVTRKHIATIRQWLLTRTVPVQEVIKSIRELESLSKKDPGDAELMAWISQAKLRQAQELLDNGQAQSGRLMFDELTGLWDNARKEQAKNAAIQFRAFQVYNQLARVDPRTKDDPKEDRYRPRASESVGAAQQAASDKDELYDDIQVTASKWYQQQGDPEKAKQIVRAFYEGHKDDQRARLEMARLLGGDAGTRPEAIRILSQDVPEDKQATGLKTFKRHDLQAQTAYQLGLLRLADYSVADAAKRKALEPVIEGGIESLRKLTSAKHYWVLGLEGRYRLVRGENVEAIRALEEASKTMPPGEVDMMYLLAQAELAGSQVGPAKWWLQRTVEAAPSWVPPRLKLTEMQLSEGDVESAKRNLAQLQQLDPNNPAVKRLADRVIVMSPKDDPGRSTETFNALPENTADQRTSKAQLALLTNRPDEAIRLLRRNLEEDPKDVRTPKVLMEIYLSRGQRDRARQAVADALKQNPDDLSLQILSLRLSDLPVDQIYARAKPLIEKTPDEGTRELQLFELERGPGGHAEQALPHLERAARLRRDDVRVFESLYGAYVTRKDWAKAEGSIKELGRLNADQCGGDLYRQRLAMARGDYAAAETLGDRLVDQYPQFAAAWLSQGQARQAQGKFEEAVRSYFEVRKRQPKHYEAIVGLAECYYQLNRPEEAKAHLAEGHRLFPSDLALWDLYLNHLVNYGDPTQAVDDRERLVKENPNDPAYRLALANTYFQSARRVSQQTNAAGASDYLTKAYNTLKAGQERFPDDGRFYAQQAELLQFANRAADAEKVLQDYGRRESVRDKPGPHLLLADFYQRLGRPALAEQALGDALVKADPREANDIRYRLASTMMQNRKYAEALAVLDGVTPRGDARAARQRIEVLIASGNTQQAMAEIDAGLRLRDTADLRTIKASVLIDSGRVAEAMTELAAATKLDPRYEMAHYMHALALAKQPRPDVDGALKELIELRGHNPRNMQYRMLLAELYAGTGRADTAARELAEGLEKEPLNKPVRLMLVRMYRGMQPPNYDAALKVCQQAEADPVLGTDPAWPREEAITFSIQKKVPEAIYKMGLVCQMAPTNVEYQHERLDMILQFNDFDAVLRESDKLLAAGLDAWWMRDQRGLALARRQDADPVQALAEFDKALAMADAARDGNAAEFVIRSMAGSVARIEPDGTRPNKRVTIGFDEAIKRTQPRTQNDPDNRWRLLLASLYRGKGDFASSSKMVEAMLADPANKPAERRLPVLRAATDVYQNSPTPDYGRARAAFTELLSLAPNDLTSLNNFAYMLAEGVNPPEPAQAKKYSERAYELSRMSGSPNDLVFDTHAWVLIQNGGGDVPNGIKILQDVVQRQPELIDAHYHLGEGYLRQAQPSKMMARVELNKALELVRKQEGAGRPIDKLLKNRILTALERATDAGEKTAQAPKGT